MIELILSKKFAENFLRRFASWRPRASAEDEPDPNNRLGVGMKTCSVEQPVALPQSRQRDSAGNRVRLEHWGFSHKPSAACDYLKNRLDRLAGPRPVLLSSTVVAGEDPRAGAGLVDNAGAAPSAASRKRTCRARNFRPRSSRSLPFP